MSAPPTTMAVWSGGDAREDTWREDTCREQKRTSRALPIAHLRSGALASLSQSPVACPSHVCVNGHGRVRYDACACNDSGCVCGLAVCVWSREGVRAGGTCAQPMSCWGAGAPLRRGAPRGGELSQYNQPMTTTTRRRRRSMRTDASGFGAVRFVSSTHSDSSSQAVAARRRHHRIGSSARVEYRWPA